MAHYEQRENKKWSVRFRICENGEEYHKRLSGFERKKDAEEAYRKYINEYNKRKSLVEPDKYILEQPFREVYLEFMNYKKTKVKESTFYDLTKLAEKRILPYFGDMKIKNIRKNNILDFQNSLSGLSYRYKGKIRGFLHSFFRYLYLYYDLDNVVSRVEPFKRTVAKKEMSIWTLEEFNKFINTFDNDLLYKTFFTFLYFTGCRLGELLAINFNDIDFINNKLDISKNVATRSFNKGFYITTPKNQSSIRKIILTKNLIESINKYIENFPECKNKQFLFGGDKPLDDHTIYRRLESHCEQAQVKRIRLHDFRHSHASLLIENGANIVLIAKRLGHTSTEQTLNTYAHLFPNAEKELVDKLEKIL